MYIIEMQSIVMSDEHSNYVLFEDTKYRSVFVWCIFNFLKKWRLIVLFIFHLITKATIKSVPQNAPVSWTYFQELTFMSITPHILLIFLSACNCCWRFFHHNSSTVAIIIAHCCTAHGEHDFNKFMCILHRKLKIFEMQTVSAFLFRMILYMSVEFVNGLFSVPMKIINYCCLK